MLFTAVYRHIEERIDLAIQGSTSTMQSSCSAGLAVFCPAVLCQPERFRDLLGTTSIQDYDTLKTRLPTQQFAHKPIDSDKGKMQLNYIGFSLVDKST